VCNIVCRSIRRSKPLALASLWLRYWEIKLIVRAPITMPRLHLSLNVQTMKITLLIILIILITLLITFLIYWQSRGYQDYSRLLECYIGLLGIITTQSIHRLIRTQITISPRLFCPDRNKLDWLSR
jgi:hypothetical protein